MASWHVCSASMARLPLSLPQYLRTSLPLPQSCFPATAVVLSEGGHHIKMADLKIGTKIHAAGDANTSCLVVSTSLLPIMRCHTLAGHLAQPKPMQHVFFGLRHRTVCLYRHPAVCCSEGTRSSPRLLLGFWLAPSHFSFWLAPSHFSAAESILQARSADLPTSRPHKRSPLWLDDIPVCGLLLVAYT